MQQQKPMTRPPLLPLVILSLVFLLDKAFGLAPVLEHTLLWKKIEPPFYASREDLFQLIQQEREPVGLILGSSRAGEFSSDFIAAHSAVKRTYNFSAPLTSPAYHYYWLDRLLHNQVQPAFVLLEADRLLFSAGAMDYALNYSFDTAFVLSHTDLTRRTGSGFSVQGRGFDFDEAETYLLKRYFSLYRYPLDFKALQENRKEVFLPDGTLLTGKALRQKLLELIDRANREKFGGIPNPLQFNVAPEAMEADAARLAERHLQRPPSGTQILFFKRMVERLAQAGIPTIIYWPLASAPLDRLQKTDSTFQRDLLAFLDDTRQKHPESHIRFLDPNPDSSLTCRSFVDSSHLSGKCFDDVTIKILNELPTTLLGRTR